MRIVALLLSVSLALPAAAEVLTRQIGETAARLELADGLPPAFAAFMRDDAGAAAEDYATEGASRVEVTDRVVHRGPRFTSMVRRTEAALGGANPFVTVEALTWDAASEDFARLDTFFDAGEARDEALIAIAHAVREGLRRDVWGGQIAPAYLPLVEQASVPDASVLANFTLSPSGLAFHFSPREVAPYAQGAIAVAVPKSAFAAWLNETGRGVF